MANGFIDADSFELTGGGASITYDVRSAQLHYRGPSRPPLRDLVEISETVTPLDTPIGRLVTATLRGSEDGDTMTVTVLLPEVNLASGDGGGSATEAPFESVAVFTTSRSSIGGPGLVEGPIQLYTSADLEGVARAGQSTSPCVFTAVLTRELPGPGVLRVEGECTLDSTGYEVCLVRHEPQGINPQDLLLDLQVTPPEFSGPAFTTYPVSYEEETTVYFETVTILPDGPSVEVQIIT
ncbi:MAG: hypothetical protein ABR540_03865 [Acidimicrobiales bacterium]